MSVNTLDFRGRVLGSVPFVAAGQTQDGITYEAILSKTHFVRLRHIFGRPVQSPIDGQVYSYGPIYFAVVNDSGGGNYAMSTRRFEDDDKALDPRRASPVTAVFERVIDPGGRLIGGHSFSGGGSYEASEAAMEQLGKVLGDHVWFDADLRQQRVQIVVCGSLG